MGLSRVIWRGEAYDIDWGQPVGHEPAFRRPAVVVSVDIVNNGSSQLVAVLPVSSTAYDLRSHIEIEPGSSGLDHNSYARCDQLRVISTERLSSRRGIAFSRADPRHRPSLAIQSRPVSKAAPEKR